MTQPADWTRFRSLATDDGVRELADFCVTYSADQLQALQLAVDSSRRDEQPRIVVVDGVRAGSPADQERRRSDADERFDRRHRRLHVETVRRARTRHARTVSAAADERI